MEPQADDNEEDTLILASKTWSQAIESSSKVGYKEGAEDGTESVYQEGFDIGYKDAFRAAFIIGAYKGLKKQLPEDTDYPEEINKHLNNTKKGACYICADDKITTDQKSVSLEELQRCQKNYTDEVITELENYFKPFLETRKIDMNLLNNF